MGQKPGCAGGAGYLQLTSALCHDIPGIVGMAVAGESHSPGTMDGCAPDNLITAFSHLMPSS